MSVHHRRIKYITFTLDGNSFECQVNTWTLNPGIEEGDRQYSQCPDGSFVEETEPQPTLELRFFSDWRSAGISGWLWENNGQTVDFVLDHHPDIVGEHVRWTGKVLVRPGPVGGDVRATEITEVTLQCPELPVYERVA